MRQISSIAVALTVVGLVVACGSSNGGTGGSASNLLCGAKGCDSGSTCDATLGCVQCTTDTQCGGGNKFCIAGKCDACRTNADCGASAPACFPGDHQCHASCTSASDCPGNIPICDVPTGQCLECKSSTDLFGSPCGLRRHVRAVRAMRREHGLSCVGSTLRR